MDHGKRLVASSNHKMYMDLKGLIRENALQYLPAKSLCRFKSVCRDWKLQISTPFFAHNQSISSRSVLGLFYQCNGKPPSFISIDPSSCGIPNPSLSFLPEPVYIKSSSNGLLLCQGQTGDKPYYICNPVLQQWKKLPIPNANHGLQSVPVLVFEPSLLNFQVDYKIIVAFPSNDFDDATEFEIYSSKEGSWKISRELCFNKFDAKCGVYANGIVYFLKGKNLFSYDIIKDRAQRVNDDYSEYGPSGPGVYGCTLGTMNGKLCVAYCEGRQIGVDIMANVHSTTMQMTSLGMWKHKEKFTIGLSTKTDQTVIAVTTNYLVSQSDGRLFSYDFQTKKSKELTTTSSGDYIRNMIWLPYVNSFASLEF